MIGRRVLVVLLLALVLPAAAPAQNTISGKVLDPQGKPVAAVEVLLHAVEEKSGNQVDRDTTRADGTFTVSAAKPDANAVYFVAVVWKGELYIGELLKPPFPKTQDYVVQVGINPVDFKTPSTTASAPVTPQQQESNRTAGLVVVLVALLLIAGIVAFALSRRPPLRRRWLLELARVEDEVARNPQPGAALQKRRAELRARLRSTPTG
jgi:hypothetical protein